MRGVARRIGILASVHMALALACMVASVQLGTRRLETGGAPGGAEVLAVGVARVLMSPMQQVLQGLADTSGPLLASGPLAILLFALNSLLWGAALYALLTVTGAMRPGGPMARAK